MNDFEKNGGIVDGAKTARDSALGVAPEGMDTATLAGTTNIAAASADPALLALYNQLKEKERQAQANGAVAQASANPMAPAGGVNGQAVAGNTPNGEPTAQNPQGSVANAPVASAQGQPGQPAPTSVATAPPVANTWASPAPPVAMARPLTIPQLGSTSPAIG